MTFRLEHYAAKKWQCNHDHKELTPVELAALKPHMVGWSVPWRIRSNETSNIIAKSKNQP
jgi:hypothetical protein